MKARLKPTTAMIGGYNHEFSTLRVEKTHAVEVQVCPFGPGVRECGTWCPAFRVETRTVKHEGKNATMLGSARWVVLSCFPQPVEYKVEESEAKP